MNQPKFSVVVVGRTEAACLPRLLGSLSEFFARGGDMVFVDTGSRDNTAQIARDAGCRVFEVGDRFRTLIDKETADAINGKFVVQPDGPIIKEGDPFFSFQDARNYAKGLALNDFICTPDCDEAWTTLDIDRLNGFIEAGWEKLFVSFVFSHFPDGSPSVKFLADTRFYDRRRITWKGIIHETMQGEAKTTTIGEDVAYLEHYQNTETDRTRYLAGLGWACHLEPGNDRNSHYFARELMYRRNYNSAIKEFHRHIDMNGWDLERGQSMVYLGDCYLAAGNDDKAMEWWGKALAQTNPRREAFLELAQYWKRKDNFRLTAAYAVAALEIPNNGFYANEVANYTFLPHELLYWAKGWMGDIPAARQHTLKVLEYQPDHSPAIRDLHYYFSDPAVSIVIPTIRPEKSDKLAKLIYDNAGYDNYEIIIEKDDPANPQGAPKVLKRGVDRSSGELVMFLGDDCVPQKNFLLHAVNEMRRRFPDMDGLIALDDMVNKRPICSHWLASKKLLPALGGDFFYTGYDHWFCDDELMARTKKMGKFYWSQIAKVRHDHPLVTGEPLDEHYRRVTSSEAVEKGRKLFVSRNGEIDNTTPFDKRRVINRIALPITRACNRDCPECSAREADKCWDRNNPHVSVKEIKRVGKTLGPIGTIEMTGGEPSLHPDFVEISEHIHDWFQCKDIMLLTNGYLFNDPEKLPLLLNYDRVYVSHYNQKFADKYGTPTNTEVHDKIRSYLKDKPVKFWSQLIENHDPIGTPPYKGVCPPHCQYDKGDSVGYGDGKIWGCCTSYWLPDKGRGIPLTPDWRGHLGEIGLPCRSCFLTGEEK